MALEVTELVGKSSGPDNFTEMPTVGGDPIVESGSNSDGGWTRWADGTQVGYANLEGVNWGNTDIAIGSGFHSESHAWNFPAPFEFVQYASTETGQLNTWMGGTGAPEGVLYNSRKYRFTSSTFQGLVRAFCIGRWK